MALPSRKDITNRRIGLFKEQIAQAMESQELEFFEELIDEYQSEYDIGHRKIAATLAYLLQKERPLQPDEHLTEDVREEHSGQQRRERTVKTADANMQTYRIEVGRKHGVEPGNIVGAISNEGKINSRDIGRIRLFDFFSLVDLPKDLPEEKLHKLRSVWVCDEQLQISLDNGGKALPSRPGRERKGFGKAAFGRKKIAGKSPFSRRSGKKDKS
jgi:ATP-dependent RNA helicase DeaD